MPRSIHTRNARLKLGLVPLLAAFILAIISLPSSASAQDHPVKNEFGLWFGGQAGNGHAVGSIANSRFYLIDARYGRLFFMNRSVALRYIAEAIPLSVLGDPRGSQRIYSYGAGASPAGVQVNLLRFGRVQPFLTAGGGFLYFNRQVFRATRFNFTAQLGAGVQLFMSRHRTIDLVYRYHHISNANLGPYNPGMDSHLLLVGVSFLR